jgi:integrase
VLFCADRGLPPSAVSADTLTAYMDHLGANLAVRSPRRTARMVVNAWNTCIGAIPPWEVGLLTMPPPRTSSYAPEFAAYPAAFQAEVAALSNRLGGRADGGLYDDSTDGTPLRRPLRPAALASRLAALRLAAGALVQSGRPITTIIGLRCLVEREARRAICTWHWERAGRRATSNTASVASTLRVIARHAVRLDTAALREVIDDTAPLIPPQTDQITEKNLKRLKQFEDPARLGALLHLPERLVEEAERLRECGRGAQAAWMAGVALAVEIELAMPLRLGNLTGLRLGQHLHGLGERSRTVHVTLAPHEVKNSTTLTFRLGPDAVTLLRRYLAEFRPLAPNADTDFVFPSRDHRDAARQASGFGKAIGEAVRRHIGVALNCHLFRCLAGVLILRDNPDAIGDLRLLLGHKGLETTLRFYALVSREGAAERHVARITRLREKTRLQAMAALGGRKLRRGTLKGGGGAR